MYQDLALARVANCSSVHYLFLLSLYFLLSFCIFFCVCVSHAVANVVFFFHAPWLMYLQAPVAPGIYYLFFEFTLTNLAKSRASTAYTSQSRLRGATAISSSSRTFLLVYQENYKKGRSEAIRHPPSPRSLTKEIFLCRLAVKKFLNELKRKPMFKTIIYF